MRANLAGFHKASMAGATVNGSFFCVCLVFCFVLFSFLCGGRLPRYREYSGHRGGAHAGAVSPAGGATARGRGVGLHRSTCVSGRSPRVGGGIPDAAPHTRAAVVFLGMLCPFCIIVWCQFIQSSVCGGRSVSGSHCLLYFSQLLVSPLWLDSRWHIWRCASVQ